MVRNFKILDIMLNLELIIKKNQTKLLNFKITL